MGDVSHNEVNKKMDFGPGKTPGSENSIKKGLLVLATRLGIKEDVLNLMNTPVKVLQGVLNEMRPKQKSPEVQLADAKRFVKEIITKDMLPLLDENKPEEAPFATGIRNIVEIPWQSGEIAQSQGKNGIVTCAQLRHETKGSGSDRVDFLIVNQYHDGINLSYVSPVTDEGGLSRFSSLSIGQNAKGMSLAFQKPNYTIDVRNFPKQLDKAKM